jgi:hypothetical protein
VGFSKEKSRELLRKKNGYSYEKNGFAAVLGSAISVSEGDIIYIFGGEDVSLLWKSGSLFTIWKHCEIVGFSEKKSRNYCEWRMIHPL